MQGNDALMFAGFCSLFNVAPFEGIFRVHTHLFESAVQLP